MLQYTKGLCGYPVNRWSVKRPPNGTKLDSGLPVVYHGHLANFGPFRERLTPAHEKKQEGCAGGGGSAGCKTDNGENARMQKTNTYADAMHMMT